MADDPYQIWTAEQMNDVGLRDEDFDKHFVLMADIDLSCYTGTEFNIIGNGTTEFSGVFDGDGHTISNFTYSSTGRSNVGLFESIRGKDAEVKDLGLIDPSIDAGEGDNIGSLVGWLAVSPPGLATDPFPLLREFHSGKKGKANPGCSLAFRFYPR